MGLLQILSKVARLHLERSPSETSYSNLMLSTKPLKRFYNGSSLRTRVRTLTRAYSLYVGHDSRRLQLARVISLIASYIKAIVNPRAFVSIRPSFFHQNRPFSFVSSLTAFCLETMQSFIVVPHCVMVELVFRVLRFTGENFGLLFGTIYLSDKIIHESMN